MSVCFLQAQRVRVAAPKQVTVGEEFQVEYVVYTQDVRRFQLGRLSNHALQEDSLPFHKPC